MNEPYNSNSVNFEEEFKINRSYQESDLDRMPYQKLAKKTVQPTTVLLDLEMAQKKLGKSANVEKEISLELNSQEDPFHSVIVERESIDFTVDNCEAKKS